MTGRKSLIPLATVAILAMLGTVTAETIYRWTDRHGQSHFSDTPPGGHSTVIRGIASDRSALPGRQGLRHGERRTLERLAQQAEHQRQVRQSRGRKAHRHRKQTQQSCREMRENLRDNRDDALRKHYARKLRKHCW